MDEVNTTAGDTTVTPPPDAVTLEQVVTSATDVALPVVQAADPETVQRLPSYTLPEPVIQGPPLDSVTVVPIETVPPLPTIEVEPVTTAPAVPTQAVEEPRVVERVVEKVVVKEVVKEVIKEIPVEKIVEKIVYRDAPSTVCPPPTDEEREAIKRDFLIELSREGTFAKYELMLAKLKKHLVQK